ncbi:sialidase family protein [Olivibacter domesticus]|uniref:exo-alpha-sialidase n=1 Tax=Olivibacter domesticus TaxID=407022 RepID=A0A1H7Q1S5_OLID1|nr:sialidase family protein [Olivibacter domesticus]SEL41277.1 sialidase-1 [Olivibacter domesticus]
MKFICSLLFSALLFGTVVAKELTLSQTHFEVPILLYKKNNPILRLKFTGNSKEGTSFRLTIRKNDGDAVKGIKAARLFIDKNKSLRNNLSDSNQLVLISESKEPTDTFVLEGKFPVVTDSIICWLAVELNSELSLSTSLSVVCSKALIADENIKVENTNNIKQHRVGVLMKDETDRAAAYRIPGLTTSNKGTLLAVFDVRHDLARDLQGNLDIGLRRSTDGGKTWEPTSIAMDRGEWEGLPEKFNGISDACILVDKQSGTIYLAGTWMYGVLDKQGKWIEGLTDTSTVWNHQWRDRGSQPGFNIKQTAQFLLVKSTDDGKTWSEPVNLTTMCKKKEWWLWAPAPGKGITMRNGTLVIPTQGRNKEGLAFSNITYSKDGGKTWLSSKPALQESTTECAVVELKDGSLMLNMRANSNRNDTSSSNGRAVAITSDMGDTWQEHPSSHQALPEPTCMASLHAQQGKLFFTNPNNKTKREQITLKVSLDEGLTWPEKYWVLLDEWNGRGYSCITEIDDGHIGVLYESSQADLVFQRIALADLMDRQ